MLISIFNLFFFPFYFLSPEVFNCRKKFNMKKVSFVSFSQCFIPFTCWLFPFTVVLFRWILFVNDEIIFACFFWLVKIPKYLCFCWPPASCNKKYIFYLNCFNFNSFCTHLILSIFVIIYFVTVTVKRIYVEIRKTNGTFTQLLQFEMQRTRDGKILLWPSE